MDRLDLTGELLSFVLANRWNVVILERAPQLGLTDWWLTAGCIAQSVWNGLFSRPPEHGIVDYDLFYFDRDTSWEAEDAVIARAAAIFVDLPVAVQIRNQARVPLWYKEKFGVAFPAVSTASDGIDKFPCATTAVGIRRDGDDFRVHAPFGLNALLAGQLIPNPVLDIPDVYLTKTKRWIEVWPKLTVQPWPPALNRYVD